MPKECQVLLERQLPGCDEHLEPVGWEVCTGVVTEADGNDTLARCDLMKATSHLSLAARRSTIWRHATAPNAVEHMKT
jgi:hypothetical protein